MRRLIVRGPGLRGPAGPAGTNGTDGTDGVDGLPGINAVPADTAVAAYVTALSSQTRSALDSAFVSQEQFDDALAAPITPYPTALSTSTPNLFAGATLPTSNASTDFQYLTRNLDAAGPRHLRAAWSQYLTGGTNVIMLMREWDGLNGTGAIVATRELFNTNGTAAYPEVSVFEWEAHPSARSVGIQYRSNDGTSAITFTELNLRQVAARSDLIVCQIDGLVNGNPGRHWYFDVPLANPDGTTPAAQRARVEFTANGPDYIMGMSDNGATFNLDDDLYDNTGHAGYRGEATNNLTTAPGMNIRSTFQNNDFIISPRGNVDAPGGALFELDDDHTYLLRGNVHGGESGRSGDVNVDFTFEADRLGDGNWRRIAAPTSQFFRCRRVRVSTHTKLSMPAGSVPVTGVFAEVDNVYTYYPDGTYRQDRMFRFTQDTYYADWFFNIRTYNNLVKLKGRQGYGSKTLGEVDYAGGDADGIVDDLSIVEPGQWATYLHPEALLCEGQAIDSDAILRHRYVTSVQTRMVRYQDGGGAKVYQRVYCTPPGATRLDSDPGNAAPDGANFVPAGATFTTRQWGMFHKPADLTYFEREVAARLGRVPDISVRYPA